MLEYLKVKGKTLSAEARIIRLEERRAKAAKRGELRFGLYQHRIHRVRPEARHTHLALGYLRGTPYRYIEAEARTSPHWDEISKMIGKYGNLNITQPAIKKLVDKWKDAVPLVRVKTPVAEVAAE